MSRIFFRHLVAATSILWLAGACFGADQVFKAPAGWRFDANNAPLATAGDAIAIASFQDARRWTASRVVQYHGAVRVDTDLPGKVYFLEYSPSGSHLLIYQAVSEQCEGEHQTTMIDASGAILWTRRDENEYHFSTTGEVVVAVGNEIELLSLSGDTKRRLSRSTLDEAGDWVDKVVLDGAGERALVLGSRTVRSVVLGATPVSTWSTAARHGEVTRAYQFTRLDSERAIVRYGMGAFQVVRLDDARVEYDYDPERLARDTERDLVYWANYEPSVGTEPGTLTLFNRTTTAYTLDLSTGRLTERAVDVSPPAGFVLRRQIEHQRLVFVSWSELRMRALTP